MRRRPRSSTGWRPPPKAREPSADELREIKDTSRDTTIEKKVEQRRASADNDLLTAAAPRE